MKTLACLSMLVTLCLGISASPLVAQEEKPFAGDGLGKLALGQKAVAVREVLGKPETKGKDEHWEATGEWVQEWDYPAQGLTLKMAAEKEDGRAHCS